MYTQRFPHRGGGGTPPHTHPPPPVLQYIVTKTVGDSVQTRSRLAEACEGCGTAETAEARFLKCVRCRVVRYCSNACQKKLIKLADLELKTPRLLASPEPRTVAGCPISIASVYGLYS